MSPTFAASINYSNGSAAVRIAEDGSGHVYYPGTPSQNGDVAIFVDSLEGAGKRYFFYDQNVGTTASSALTPAEMTQHQQSMPETLSRKQMRATARVKNRSKHLLATFDERGIGYAVERLDAYPLITPLPSSSSSSSHQNWNNNNKGIVADCKDFVPTMNQRHKCHTCGKPNTDHAVGRKLNLTVEGGDVTDTRGNIVMKWLWDTRRQNAGTPPGAGGVIMRLNPFFTLQYTSQHEIRVDFECEGIHRSFACGASVNLRQSYDQTATRSMFFKGKFDVQVPGRPSLATRTAAIVAESSEAKLHVQELIRGVGLGEMVDGLEETMHAARARSRALAAGSATGSLDLTGRRTHLQLGMNIGSLGHGSTASIRLDLTGNDPRKAALEATNREAPIWMRYPTGGLLSATARSLGVTTTTTTTTTTAASPTKSATTTTKSKGILSAVEDALGGTLNLSSTDGYGSLAGASMHNGKWLTGVDTLRKLQTMHPPHKKSDLLKAASGKLDLYKLTLVKNTKDIHFRPVLSIQGDELKQFLTGVTRHDQTVLVAMLHPAETLCRKSRQLLEHVNSTLAAAFPDDPQFEDELDGLQQQKGGGNSGKMCPFRIVTYDMSAPSPQVTKQYNVKSLPYFLIFKGGTEQLVYAGPMGGAGVFALKGSARPVNTLIADTSSVDAMTAEKHLKWHKYPHNVVCGIFNASVNKIVGTCDAAVKMISSTATNAANVRRLQASMRDEKVAASSSSSSSGALSSAPALGTDATSQLPSDYALVLLDATCGSVQEVSAVASAMASASFSTTSGGGNNSGSGHVSGNGGVSAGTSQVRLVGKSLLVACWPTGSVRCHNAMCDMCTKLIRRTASSSAPSASIATTSSAPKEEWACPHCGVIQNASHATLLEGRASIAVMKTIKGGTLDALTAYWRLLLVGAGYSVGAGGDGMDTASLLHSIGANTADPRVIQAIAAIPLVGLTLEQKGGMAVDDVHVGLTHNDVLGRLIDAAKRGGGNGNAKIPSIGVSISETTMRGVPLTN